MDREAWQATVHARHDWQEELDKELDTTEVS